MIKKIRQVLLAMSAVVLFVPAVASAEISILNRTGEISITMPDGQQVTVGPTEHLPAIPDNAIVTIVSGSADISASESSRIQVVCGGYSAAISASNALSALLDPQAGLISMTLIYGTAEIKSPDGSVIVLDAKNPSFQAYLSGKGKDIDPQGLPTENELKQEEQGNSHDISPAS